MTSKAERIADAVHASMTTPAMSSVPAASVVRDLHGALASDDLPAIAVETGDEDAPVRMVLGHKERVTEIHVTVVAQGAFADADPALVEAYGRIAADWTLGGLVFELEEGPTRRERQDGERQLVAVTKVFRAQYRTTESSLEN